MGGQVGQGSYKLILENLKDDMSTALLEVELKKIASEQEAKGKGIGAGDPFKYRVTRPKGGKTMIGELQFHDKKDADDFKEIASTWEGADGGPVSVCYDTEYGGLGGALLWDQFRRRATGEHSGSPISMDTSKGIEFLSLFYSLNPFPSSFP